MCQFYESVSRNINCCESVAGKVDWANSIWTARKYQLLGLRSSLTWNVHAVVCTRICCANMRTENREKPAHEDASRHFAGSRAALWYQSFQSYYEPISKVFGEMNEVLSLEVRYVLVVCSSVLLVVAVNPWMFLASFPLVTSLTFLAVYYFLRTAREVKRLEAIACSPLCAHVAETIDGVVVIRACSMEEPHIDLLYRFV